MFELQLNTQTQRIWHMKLIHNSERKLRLHILLFKSVYFNNFFLIIKNKLRIE